MTFKLVSACLVSVVLCGCARMPTVYSDDGAAMTFAKDSSEYTRPSQVTTKCRVDPTRELTICDDGTASTIISAGLPFHGVVLIEFDGRRFHPKSKAP